MSGLRQGLRSAWQHPRIAVGAAAAILAIAVVAVYRPSLWPPELHPRALQVAAASTTLLVNEPLGRIPDSSYSYEERVNQALLTGSVLLSPIVLDRVSRSLGISSRAIASSPPVTANVPAALIVPGPAGGPTDILRRPNHYRLEVQVDPAVPIIRVFTQAPSAAQAEALADGVAHSLASYVHTSQARAGVPLARRVAVRQLGQATGGTAPTTGPAQIVLILFGAGALAALAISQPLLRKIATYSSR